MADFVAKFEGSNYTQEDMKNAFDFISDPEDWKGPINRRIWSADADDMKNSIRRFRAACEFFTGTELSVEWIRPREYHVRSIGYRAGPCGDH